MKRNQVAVAGALFKIGLNIRQAREKRGLTLDEIARRTELSKGLLSKIENFRTLPSLPALAAIAQSLGVSLDRLMQGAGVDAARPPACQLVPAGQRAPLKREQSRGFHYAALMSRPLTGLVFESVVLKLAPNARRKPVTTDGDEFIFMLKGAIEMQVGGQSFRLAVGDALFFDGRQPHTPRNVTDKTTELLAIYLLKRRGGR